MGGVADSAGLGNDRSQMPPITKTSTSMATTAAAEKKAATAAKTSGAGIPKEVWLDLHRRMVRIRHLEEPLGRISSEGRVPGFIHLYVGQEAVAAGGCAALKEPPTWQAR